VHVHVHNSSASSLYCQQLKDLSLDPVTVAVAATQLLSACLGYEAHICFIILLLDRLRCGWTMATVHYLALVGSREYFITISAIYSLKILHRKQNPF